MITFKEFLNEIFIPKEIQKFKSDIRKPAGDNLTLLDNLNAYFEKYGYIRSGRGFYADVFTKNDKDEVIKVYVNDSAYDKWVTFMLKHQDNPYIPKIKGRPTTIYSDTSNKWKFIRLEKLTPLSVNQFEKFYDNIAGAFIYNKINRKSVDPRLRLVLSYIKAVNKHNAGVSVDLHSGNVMKRYDGQIVITDPFA